MVWLDIQGDSRADIQKNQRGGSVPVGQYLDNCWVLGKLGLRMKY